MARVPTSKDVARVAGVSQSTVSYVMSGKRPISERTRRLVEDAMEQLLYQPHAGARALASQRTNIIAVVHPVLAGLGVGGILPFIDEIAAGARARDHDVLLVTADEGSAGLRRVSGRALCDAMVVMEVKSRDERAAVAPSLAQPVLFIGLPEEALAQGSPVHCIDFDFEGGARLLVRELVASASQEVVVVGWGPEVVERDVNYVPRFRRAAEAEAAAAGAPLRWLEVSRDSASIRAALDEVGVDGPGRSLPGLLLADNVGETVSALLGRGVRPGRDLDVVALCTDAEAEAMPVPVTAVSQQPRDVSRHAVEWLFRLLDDPSAPGEVRLVPATLARRQSVRPAP
ncbi:LacI family DNA-binding transcriptional regulator [Kineococcus sp. T13]|uniref:LacI family DNA-binding transcriptional regulator n=1 Tax=Kineococcus vitellinus TaxID=2696565 RepID=UPI0014121E6D|nr:LacI family DNA-binding transcriptional regulator [Kineococcus vitellinus]